MTDLDPEPSVEQFCNRAWPKLARALGMYVGDRYVGEELAQEALARAYARWRYVRRLESPEGWTYHVGVNLARSRFRRLRSERRARARDVGVTAERSFEDQYADRGQIAAALAELTDKQREAVILRYFLDLSAEEVARTMGLRAGAVRGLTHRAIERLRDQLKLEITERG